MPGGGTHQSLDYMYRAWWEQTVKQTESARAVVREVCFDSRNGMTAAEDLDG